MYPNVYVSLFVTTSKRPRLHSRYPIQRIYPMFILPQGYICNILVHMDVRMHSFCVYVLILFYVLICMCVHTYVCPCITWTICMPEGTSVLVCTCLTGSLSQCSLQGRIWNPFSTISWMSGYSYFVLTPSSSQRSDQRTALL